MYLFRLFGRWLSNRRGQSITLSLTTTRQKSMDNIMDVFRCLLVRLKKKRLLQKAKLLCSRVLSSSDCSPCDRTLTLCFFRDLIGWIEIRYPFTQMETGLVFCRCMAKPGRKTKTHKILICLQMFFLKGESCESECMLEWTKHDISFQLDFKIL